MRKYYFLIPIILTGCTTSPIRDIETARTELEATYAELTSGEKTLEKAYKVYDFYTVDGVSSPSSIDTKCPTHWGGDYYGGFYSTAGKWPFPVCGPDAYGCWGMLFGSMEFGLRFCTLDSFTDYGMWYQALKVRMFEQKAGLVVSDKERYCLESKCVVGDRWFEIKEFIHNEDECIILRRKLVNDDIRCQGVFDHKMYLPDDVKISTLETFEKLRDAYATDIKECKRARDALETTSVEYQNCIDSVEQKLQELIKSGILEKENKVAHAEQEQQRATNLADCEQAIKKAKQRKRETGLKSFYVFEEGFYVFTDQGKFSGGITENIPTDSQYVSDFASDGVFIQGNDKFIYTKDKDYATGDKFRGKGLVYTKVGNYKYKTVTGATKSVPAFKATKYKASEINYTAYLKNKEIRCCKTTEGKVGIDGEYAGECNTK